MTQEIHVTEVSIIASPILAQIVSEENVQFVPLPHNDESHKPWSLLPKLLNDFTQPLRHGIFSGFENSSINIDCRNTLGAENVSDLGEDDMRAFVVPYRAFSQPFLPD